MPSLGARGTALSHFHGPTGSQALLALILGAALLIAFFGPGATEGRVGTGVPAGPQFHVAASPVSGQAPLVVTFWGNVTGTTGTVGVQWSFGDSASGTGSPVRHTYENAGTFTAAATATINGSSFSGNTGEVTITVSPCTSCGAPLEVAIAPTPTQGSTPLPVSLTVSATGGTAPYNASVCFGDGTCQFLPSSWNGATDTLTHTYEQPGIFTIVASLNDSKGQTTSSTAALSVLSEPPFAIHGAMTPSSGGTAPFTAQFVASVSGGSPPYSIQWNFGDGSAGSGVVGSPTSHTYTMSGTFVPTLTVMDSAGHTQTYTLSSVTVVAPPPPPSHGGNGPVQAWVGANASTIGAVGLILVVMVFAFLVERRRRQEEVVREADDLMRAMENDQEGP